MRPGITLKVLAATLALCVQARSAQADVLYQSIPDLGADPFFSACSNCPLGGAEAIDAFSLASQSTITEIIFGASDFAAAHTPFPTNVTVKIFAAPGFVIGSNTPLYEHVFTQFVSDVAAGFDDTNIANPRVGAVHLVTVAPTNLQLDGGKYAISFFNNDGLSVPIYIPTNGGQYDSVAPGAEAGVDLDKGSFSLAFAVKGTPGKPVPAPLIGSGLLAWLALAAFAAQRRGATLVRSFLAAEPRTA
jgi:hypothetical protein